MTCFNPIQARMGRKKQNGKHEIVFIGAKDQRDENVIKLPCGKCIGCLRNRAREWSIRCVHESQLNEQNCFITLTYNKENLPATGSLQLRDFQLFMKRLRKWVWKHENKKLRFFHCGEYGPKLQRPHYHVLIFGYDFTDKIVYSTNGLGQRVYRSKILETIWTKGFSTIGNVTEESAQYVSRYTLKKVYGKEKNEHYGTKRPEYVTMSKRPGIGFQFLQKYKSDMYPKGSVVFNGHEQMPPRYYDKIYQEENPYIMEEIKEDRKKRADRVRATDYIENKRKKVSNNDSFRLPVRQRIVEERMKNLKRFWEES
ncbi:MAG: replication initiator protein [Microvirus sp.]|nr:MAG: replication initiator protein [Microvirus sp.]